MNENSINFHKLEQDLFENEEFIELLGNFSTAGLKKIKTDDQLAGIYKKFDEICCKVMDTKPHDFQIYERSFEDDGIVIEKDRMIVFSESLAKKNPFLMLEEYFEQIRYRQQEQAVELKNKNKDFSAKEFEKIANCYAVSKVAHIDEAMLDEGGDPLYKYLPHVMDARKYVCEMIKRTIKESNKNYKDNKKVQEYLVTFYDDSYKYYDKSYTERAYAKVLEAKKTIDVMNEEVEQFLTKCVDFKKVSDVSDEVLYCLMAPNIEAFYMEKFKTKNVKIKAQVLNEYLRRLSVNLGFNDRFDAERTFKEEIKESKLGNYEVLAANIHFISPTLKMLILSDFDDFASLNHVDLETRKKVKLNIYRDKNGEYINLFSPNTIEGFWQPVAALVEKYMKVERNKTIHAMRKMFKSEAIIQETEKNFLVIDEQKVRRHLEQIHDMPIEQIEEILFYDMLERIVLDINERNDSQKSSNVEKYVDYKISMGDSKRKR